jgi:proteasome accessory factor B
MHPLERLINLVAMLLEARRPLTFEQIRVALPAYAQDDLATAKRMFERDKDILRDNGIPIEMESVDALEVEEGYVILKDRYYVPEISFTPQEISALFVAAHSGADDTSAGQGVRKLLYGADGGLLAGLATGPLAAGPDVDTARLLAVAEAVLEGPRSITFGYTTSKGVSSERRVDAFGLVWRAGHWYVVASLPAASGPPITSTSGRGGPASRPSEPRSPSRRTSRGGRPPGCGMRRSASRATTGGSR